MDFDTKDIVITATSVVTVASLIASLTPTRKDDRILSVIGKILDILALNFGSKRR